MGVGPMELAGWGATAPLRGVQRSSLPKGRRVRNSSSAEGYGVEAAREGYRPPCPIVSCAHHRHTPCEANIMGTLRDILTVPRRERARLFAKYGLKNMAVLGAATRDVLWLASDVDITGSSSRRSGWSSSIRGTSWATSFPVRRIWSCVLP